MWDLTNLISSCAMRYLSSFSKFYDWNIALSNQFLGIVWFLIYQCSIFNKSFDFLFYVTSIVFSLFIGSIYLFDSDEIIFLGREGRDASVLILVFYYDFIETLCDMTLFFPMENHICSFLRLNFFAYYLLLNFNIYLSSAVFFLISYFFYLFSIFLALILS